MNAHEVKQYNTIENNTIQHKIRDTSVKKGDTSWDFFVKITESSDTPKPQAWRNHQCEKAEDNYFKFNHIGNQCYSLRLLIVLNYIHLAIYLVFLKHQCGFIVWSLHKLLLESECNSVIGAT